MNRVELIGRLVREPEVRYSTNGDPMATARFTLAVKRRFSQQEEASDFIACIAFRKTAEFCGKYFRKGMRVGITGRIRTGNYTNQEGRTVYTTTVVVDEAEFLDPVKKEQTEDEPFPSRDGYGFSDIPDGIETPFD